MSDNEVKSPCMSVCALDNENICIGCYRSAQEITDWSILSKQDKTAVMVAVNRRHKKRNEKF